MSATVKQVIDEARTWVETPFLHQGRIKGRGADCVGLIIGVAHALGLTEFDYREYGRIPVPEKMGQILEDNLIKVDSSEIQPGCVLWLSFIKPRHLALLTDNNTIIHINERIAPRKRGELRGRCVEHVLDDAWKRRIVQVYKIPGVRYG